MQSNTQQKKKGRVWRKETSSSFQKVPGMMRENWMSCFGDATGGSLYDKNDFPRPGISSIIPGPDDKSMLAGSELIDDKGKILCF
jgi:hypothetical protein